MKAKRKEDRWTPIQKTMFLPLLARATESEATDPAIKDGLALEIIKNLDPDIRLKFDDMPELSRLAWISRSLCFDRLIKDFIVRFPAGTVVNIGCGLDTTYDRMQIRPAMWYDLDFPEVIEFRKKFIKESPSRRFIAASFLSAGWHDEIRFHDNILFVAAGVFYYYNEDLIRRFILRLIHTYPKCELIFNATSQYGVQAANRILHKKGNNEDPSLKWGLKGINTLLSWSPRIIFLGKYTCFKGSCLRMSWKERILGYISDLLNIEYTIHLRIRMDYRHLR